MAAHTPLTAEEISDLASRWGLEVTSSRPFGGGLNNTSHLLQTTFGPVVLTVVDFASGLPVEMHAQLLSHLDRAGIPVNEPLRALDGRFLGDHEGKPVMLKRFLPGHAPGELDDGRLRELGSVLARVGRVQPPPGIRKAKRRLPPNHAEIVSTWPDRDHAQWVDYNAGRIAKLEQADLDIGLVHGDPFPDNTVLSDDGRLYVIDWETASIDMLVLDIAFAALGSCRRDNQIDDDRVQVLLDGYSSVRSLRQAELDVLPDAIVYAAIVIGFWRYQQINMLHPEPAKADLYKEMVEFVATL